MADLRSVGDAWTSEVWAHVGAEVERLRQKAATTKSDGAVGASYQAEAMLSSVRNSGSKDLRLHRSIYALDTSDLCPHFIT